MDLLPALLLPLAGPEQFEGEEDKMEQLPEDLQYLPDSKEREPDPDIRKMLIETLMKVCVCMREREREKEGGGKRMYLYVLCVCLHVCMSMNEW